MPKETKENQPKQPGIFSLLKPYWGMITLLLIFALFSNGINLLLPKIIADGIDSYTHHQFNLKHIVTEFCTAVILIFVFGYLQSIIQTFASERVARDLRTRLAESAVWTASTASSGHGIRTSRVIRTPGA